MKKLKPCPFCGSKDVKLHGNFQCGYGVFCEECYSETTAFYTPDEAIAAWNSRDNTQNYEHFCSVCGHVIPDGYDFCPRCLEKVDNG